MLRHRDDLLEFLGRRSGAVSRYESPEDLLQGLFSDLLSHPERFDPTDTDAERAWLFGAAKRFVAMRRRHWAALKRGTSRMLRQDRAADSRTGFENPAIESFAASQTGPSTFASRREQLVLATRALSLLMPRDQELVRLASQGLSNEDIARRLALDVATAARAKSRALERLRKTHELVLRRGRGPSAGSEQP